MPPSVVKSDVWKCRKTNEQNLWICSDSDVIP